MADGVDGTMLTRVSSLFVAITIFVCSGILRAKALNCTDTLTPCRCKGPNVDIDITNAFDYPYNITNNPQGDNPLKYSYLFSPCTPLEKCGNNAPANTVVMCQHNLLSPNNRDASLGTGAAVEWLGADGKTVTIRYKGGDEAENKGRWTEIQVTVEGKDDVIEYVGEDDKIKDYFLYKFKMTLKSDTPNIGPGGGGGVSSGWAGIVIIVVVLLALVLYFVIGSVFLYRVKGARGVEAFPNYVFWKELPILVKDGFCFTISPCLNKINSSKGTYQAL